MKWGVSLKPKMQSAIEKITLTDATFKGDVIEPTFVNFFYGKNGAGKSTIAQTIRSNTDIQWTSDKIESDFDILVYNTDFVEGNFKNYGNLAGVFTVNETNIAIQEQVKRLSIELKQKGNEYDVRKTTIDEKIIDKENALSELQSLLETNLQ